MTSSNLQVKGYITEAVLSDLVEGGCVVIPILPFSRVNLITG